MGSERPREWIGTSNMEISSAPDQHIDGSAATSRCDVHSHSSLDEGSDTALDSDDAKQAPSCMKAASKRLSAPCERCAQWLGQLISAEEEPDAEMLEAMQTLLELPRRGRIILPPGVPRPRS